MRLAALMALLLVAESIPIAAGCGNTADEPATADAADTNGSPDDAGSSPDAADGSADSMAWDVVDVADVAGTDIAPLEDAPTTAWDIVDTRSTDVTDGMDDVPGPTDSSDSGADVVPAFDPAVWGPYEVGMTSFNWFDTPRLRTVPVTVWYPAVPTGQPLATYLAVLHGRAYQWAPADRSGAPYPLVLFSHGFRGTAVQSITFTEYLASHGYVVAAMDHQGNTLTDFFATDETVAQVAIDRPRDVAFTYWQMTPYAEPGGELLSGMVDLDHVGVSGHSFGGYTALVVAGGQVDVSQAQAACAAGDPSDIFCDYVGYWEAGTTQRLFPGIPNLAAGVYFAAGGYSAFGEAGLLTIDVPSLIFGGTLDSTCSPDAEIHRIYAGLPTPKAEVIITDGSHMSFTNICDVPLAQQFLADYCDVPGIIDQEEGFRVINTLAVAFFDRYLKGQTQYLDVLSQDYVDDLCGCAAFASEG